MVDIFVPTYRDTIRIPAKQVVPNPGDLVMDCVCGGRDWGIHVTPDEAGAVISEVFCKRCNKAHRVSKKARIMADGKVNAQGRQ